MGVDLGVNFDRSVDLLGNGFDLGFCIDKKLLRGGSQG